jgi:hypothetical protein
MSVQAEPRSAAKTSASTPESACAAKNGVSSCTIVSLTSGRRSRTFCT